MPEADIVATARTAGGRRGGRLSGWHPADLAAQVLDALVERSGADPALIEDVIVSCVMQAGAQANNVARGAVPASRLPESVPATTPTKASASTPRSRASARPSCAALQQRGKRYGLQTMCEGGGMANVTIVERL